MCDALLQGGVAEFQALPVVPLGQYPTPVIRLEVAGYPPFWVKDDGRTGTVYGGNKVRKLEYLLASARQRGKHKLIVAGDAESHTVHACARVGRAAGFSVEAVIYRHGKSVGAMDAEADLRSTGARVIRARTFLGALIASRLRAVLTGGVLVPLGGSSPLSTVGYVRAALELQRQVNEGLLPAPQRIYVAFASGGTAAGLLIGLALSGAPTRVVAVQTVESAIANRRRLVQLVSRTLAHARISRVRVETVMDRLERIDASCLGRGYRDVPADVQNAVDLMAGQPVRVDPAFTAKTLAVMLKDLSRDPSSRALFWNTHSSVEHLRGPRRHNGGITEPLP